MADDQEVLNVGTHLLLVAQRINEQIDSDIGTLMFFGSLSELCPNCCLKLNEPLPVTGNISDEVAVALMRKAAGTKKSIPAPARWRVDAELKPKLEQEYRDYVRVLVGSCEANHAQESDQDASRFVMTLAMPDGTTKRLTVGDIGFSTLWADLSGDAGFMRRFMEVYEPYVGRVMLSAFRFHLLKLCCKRRVASPVEALPLLDELAREYIGQWSN
ncbi:MAG: hypothetical protein WCK01_02370 [Candidatus Uhrbacteria bacterium]